MSDMSILCYLREHRYGMELITYNLFYPEEREGEMGHDAIWCLAAWPPINYGHIRIRILMKQTQMYICTLKNLY